MHATNFLHLFFFMISLRNRSPLLYSSVFPNTYSLLSLSGKKFLTINSSIKVSKLRFSFKNTNNRLTVSSSRQSEKETFQLMMFIVQTLIYWMYFFSESYVHIVKKTALWLDNIYENTGQVYNTDVSNAYDDRRQTILSFQS